MSSSLPVTIVGLMGVLSSSASSCVNFSSKIDNYYIKNEMIENKRFVNINDDYSFIPQYNHKAFTESKEFIHLSILDNSPFYAFKEFDYLIDNAIKVINNIGLLEINPEIDAEIDKYFASTDKRKSKEIVF